MLVELPNVLAGEPVPNVLAGEPVPKVFFGEPVPKVLLGEPEELLQQSRVPSLPALTASGPPGG